MLITLELQAYVIYKPWLVGLLRIYTTRDRGQKKFAVSGRILRIDRKNVVHILYSMMSVAGVRVGIRKRRAKNQFLAG